MQWLVNMCVKMNTCVKINMCAISGRRGPVTNMNKLSYEHVVSLMIQDSTCSYGVATISRLLEIIGLFCKRALQKRSYSAYQTYNCVTNIHKLWARRVSDDPRHNVFICQKHWERRVDHSPCGSDVGSWVSTDVHLDNHKIQKIGTNFTVPCGSRLFE